jgi:hypothetical protein
MHPLWKLHLYRQSRDVAVMVMAVAETEEIHDAHVEVHEERSVFVQNLIKKSSASVA